MLFDAAAQQQLRQDRSNSTFLPFLPSDAPDNEEIAMRIAQHIGTDTAAHGFGKLSTDEIAVQVEDLLNRYSAGDENLLAKTIRQGKPSEARVIYDPNTGLQVTVNPIASGYGTAMYQSLQQFYNFGQ